MQEFNLSFKLAPPGDLNLTRLLVGFELSKMEFSCTVIDILLLTAILLEGSPSEESL